MVNVQVPSQKEGTLFAIDANARVGNKAKSK
jgi:hypothetical protein